MKWNGVASTITGMAAIISLAFGVWFTITGAIAGEAEKLQQSISGIRLQQQVEDVDFAIYQVTHKMDIIEQRVDNGKAYANDPTQLKILQRQLNVLLRRKDTVTKRVEAKAE